MKKQLMVAFLALCAVFGNALAQEEAAPRWPSGQGIAVIDVKHGTPCETDGLIGMSARGGGLLNCVNGFWQKAGEDVLPTLIFENGTTTTFVAADGGGRDGVRYLTPGKVFDGERIVSFAGTCWHEKHTLVALRKSMVPGSPVEMPEVMTERKSIQCPTAGS